MQMAPERGGIEIVIKRDHRQERFQLEKLQKRLRRCMGDDIHEVEDRRLYPYSGIHVNAVLETFMQGTRQKMTTTEIDNLLGETCAFQQQNNHDFSRLAGRLVASALWKECCVHTFSDAIRSLYNYDKLLIAKDVYDFVIAHEETLNAAIDMKRDLRFDYFGIQTLRRSYLLTLRDTLIETPQFLYMRVACGIHVGHLEDVLRDYDYLSQGFYSLPSSALCCAGGQRSQTASCFLLTTPDDSVESIFDTLRQTALISRSGGGIGVSVQNIRSRGSPVQGIEEVASGLVAMLQIFNATARYINRLGCQRKGAFAFYLEPWHPEIFEFLDLRKNFGSLDKRARDIFTALWVPDLFMQRVWEDAEWSLMDPGCAKRLVDTWGEEFEQAYVEYEQEGEAVIQRLPARRLWTAIVMSQIDTGVPYILFKDACNMRCNQKHRGIIRGSNLCCEVVQYASKDEIAVCNLASVALPRYVVTGDGPRSLDSAINWELLREVVHHVTLTVNRCIDRGWSPVPEANISNNANRAIGIGVQGLADVFALLEYPYDSDEARLLNQLIFEHIYYAALETSCSLAEKDGPYATYAGSPSSQGLLQFDLCQLDERRRQRLRLHQQAPLPPCSCSCHQTSQTCCDNYFVSCCSCYLSLKRLGAHLPWLALKRKIRAYGLRNSLVTAPMPTASTAHILGNCECERFVRLYNTVKLSAFEPFTSNVFRRSVLAGEFVVTNHYLIEALSAVDLWDAEMKESLIAAGGSVQNIARVPDTLKRRFKTAWELSQRVLIDYSRDRGLFVDQSQSLNLYLQEPSFSKVTSMLFYAWEQGLKTGLYYLRTRPAHNPIPVTISVSAQEIATRAKNGKPISPRLACASCES